MSIVEHSGIAYLDTEMEKAGQVKRPMNAFMLWSKEKRRKISSVDPSLHNSHISKILGEEWKKLPTNEKDPYIKESKSLMDKHKKEHPDYHYKPRQNKLTKALKELSSLHSTFSSPPGFASKIRSLTALSAFVNVPHTGRCDPYQAYYRSKAFQRYKREQSHGPYYEIPEQYSNHASCSGCTCSLECADESWMARERYIEQNRKLAYYGGCRSSRASLIGKPDQGNSQWGYYSVPSRCGWSVPTLVEDVFERPKHENDNTEEKRLETDQEKSAPCGEDTIKDGCINDS